MLWLGEDSEGSDLDVPTGPFPAAMPRVATPPPSRRRRTKRRAKKHFCGVKHWSVTEFNTAFPGNIGAVQGLEGAREVIVLCAHDLHAVFLEKFGVYAMHIWEGDRIITAPEVRGLIVAARAEARLAATRETRGEARDARVEQKA